MPVPVLAPSGRAAAGCVNRAVRASARAVRASSRAVRHSAPFVRRGRRLPPALVAALAGGLLAVPPSVAQQASPEPRPAAVGAVVADSLAAAATHAFTLEVAGGTFVRGSVEQVSVDVVVTVKGPGGNTVARFDGPAEGPEFYAFDADDPGTYRIEVAPFEEGTGRYAFSLAAAEPIAEEPAARVDQLFAGFDRPGVPGAVVGVVRDGELVFERGYGEANLRYGIPFTPTTPTNIGSTSKQFTAFAIQLLAHRGELSLDDDVRDHLPEIKDFGETVTIRHLLTHTSGYREFLNLLGMAGRRLDYDYVARSELVEIVDRQPELQNAPGSEWNYNNTGYGLLAEVVAKVGGAPFPQWMRDNVFLPLGMQRTMVRTDPRTIVPGAAMGYVQDRAGFKEASDLGGAMGAGGIYSTVEDLAVWMANYFDPRVGDEAIVAEMMTRYELTTGDTASYGLGLFVDEFRGRRRVHHGGADIAHRSSFVMLPDLRSGVIVLSNFASFPGGITQQVAEAFFADDLPGLGAESETVAADAAYDPSSFDPATFDDYAGRYAIEEMPAFVLEFRRENDGYVIQATGQPPAPLEPTSDSTFRITVVDASVTFHREAGGAVRTMTLHQNGDHPATRIAEEPRDEAELAAYAGRYFSPEVEAFWTIEVRKGGLVAEHRRLDPVELTPNPSDPDAFGGAFPLVTVGFERAEDGEVSGFRAGNGRTRGVWFERVED
ncbi:MAG TPA: serine hydrolase [Longimicrobiales bacterium]|nr:serine hydrolase [Longimicrobiales bacterium]